MKESQEFNTMGELLESDGVGFVILHQEKALGNDFRDQGAVNAQIVSRLREESRQGKDLVSQRLGEPTEISEEWKENVPVWASAGGYSVWKNDVDFVSVFISWDNPEDPSFVIAARGLIADFSNDIMNPFPDPWGSEWMMKGKW